MRVFWYKEKCKIEALKYKSRSEFKIKSGSVYNFILKNNFLDKICSHMIPIGHRYKNCIYAYKFNNNYVYIVLTYNINKRYLKYLKKGTIFNYIHNYNNNYRLIQLTEYVDVNIAIKKKNILY